MKGGIIAFFAILAVVSLTAQQGQAVNCGQVDAALAPCITFLTTGSGDPSPGCCAGVRTVKGLAQTTADKRAACSCVKAAAGHYDLKDAAAQSLPTKCGVQLDIPVSRTVDCDQIA